MKLPTTSFLDFGDASYNRLRQVVVAVSFDSSWQHVSSSAPLLK